MFQYLILLKSGLVLFWTSTKRDLIPLSSRACRARRDRSRTSFSCLADERCVRLCSVEVDARGADVVDSVVGGTDDKLLLLLLEEVVDVAVAATNELASGHELANVGEGTEADADDNLETAAQVFEATPAA
jgi:hypothetical protein